MSLTKSKEGENSIPRQGIHKYRIPGIDLATLDVVGTVLAAVPISYAISYYSELNINFMVLLIIVIILLFVIATGVHYYLGIQTQLMTYLNIKVPA